MQAQRDQNRQDKSRRDEKLLPLAQRHLVNRFSYGIDPRLAKDVRRAGGAREWFDRQLTAPHAFDDRETKRLRHWWPDLDRGPADLWQRQEAEVRGGWEVMEDYGRWLLARRIHTRRPVAEKLTEFWESMLHVPVSGDPHFTWRVSYGDTIRDHALGRFDKLLVAAVTHPAMLIYLNAATSTKKAPNENLGRELLELHTVGTGQYTEDDVKASSRILTGWHVDMWETWADSYVPTDHWRGKVRVKGFRHGNRKRDGRKVTKEYLRYLAHHPATARHVCERLVVKFVRDDPPPKLVAHLAKVYRANDTAIVPVLRALVDSAAFQASAGRKLRDPGEDVVATYRVLRVRVDPPVSPDSGANAMLWQAKALGLTPHAWPRPDGTPVVNEVWASPARALASMDVHWAMSGGFWPSQGLRHRPAESWLPDGPVRFAGLVDHLSRELLHRPASKRLVETASLATGVGARERIDADHDLVKWDFTRLLAAVLDSPEHAGC